VLFSHNLIAFCSGERQRRYVLSENKMGNSFYWNSFLCRAQCILEEKLNMALTASNPLELGTAAPSFSLKDTVSDRNLNLSDLKGIQGTAIFFICNHCPFVLHINEELVRMANDYSKKGIAFFAISSNNVETHPQDGPEFMKVHAEKHGYPFPYLYDETQEVAKAYDARCTPDLYLFDADLKAVYHGQLDDSRPGNDLPVSGKDFRNAMDQLLVGNDPLSEQKPSIGCGIKWK